MSANDKQVGGGHYGGGKVQHWDFVWAEELDYFQGQITKYIIRWKKKNGLQDLKKAQHFLDKYIELVEADLEGRIRKAEAAGLGVGIGADPPGPLDHSIRNALVGAVEELEEDPQYVRGEIRMPPLPGEEVEQQREISASKGVDEPRYRSPRALKKD